MSKVISAVVFVWTAVSKFIGPSSGTSHDVLNSQDIFRVIFGPKVVALGVAMVIMILQGLGVIVAAANIPIVSWLALWVGGMVIELLRRLPQYDPNLVADKVTRLVPVNPQPEPAQKPAVLPAAAEPATDPFGPVAKPAPTARPWMPN